MMNSFAALLAAAAALLPSSPENPGRTVLPAVSAGYAVGNDGELRWKAGLRKGANLAAGVPRQSPFTTLFEVHREQVNQQVRVERRVVIRVAPSPPSVRQQMMAAIPKRSMRTRFLERPLGHCIPARDIVGLQTVAPNRLLLFMKDRRILSLALGRACRARDFYSGFYVEPNKDDQLCEGRDRLLSRAGVSCGVEKLNKLVAIRE
ncbi:hypothetical protein [Altericroceibacterium endophyticum]|uniref:Uncharacterized protein n=1 Tax=Altericroceibacterium endophyticum TaxID=1808508 RepID=A0A6I4T0F9_9SPHN|nr:hypothetical protein [Altericroceibacterium endophyticum]MXO64376.1 hypothetical protein [Altericroceibacterium endophyticum]